MKKLIISILSIFVVVEALACTTAIVSAGASASGRPLLMKQRDASNDYNVVVHSRGEKFGFTAIVTDKVAAKWLETGTVSSCYGGVNEAGFAIINNISYNRAGTDTPLDVQNGVMMARALACCRSVDDFIAMLEAEPKPMALEANFGVIDAQGGAAYIECGNLDWTRYDVPENGWLVRSNFSLSGNVDSGKGQVRYDSAQHIMNTHKGSFDPEFLIEGFARSFWNDASGADMMKKFPKGSVNDTELIARSSSTCCICIEGVGTGDRDNSSVMWTVTGYSPCIYAIPVWVAAGEEIPASLGPGVDGRSPANNLSVELKQKVHHLDRDAAGTYVDIAMLKPILKSVRRAEKTEFHEGRAVDAQMRRAFNIDDIKKLNLDIDARFSKFVYSQQSL